MFADIQSSNIVGYATKADDAKAYQTMGSMFVTVGGEGTWKLGDMKMICDGNDGGAYGYSTIQFIDPASSVIKNENVYTYYGVADGATVGEDDGWYTQYGDEFSNDISFSCGTAFLCNFDPAYSTSIQFAGQVVTKDVTIESTVDGVPVAYMYLVNPFPVDISLAEVKMIVDGQDGGAYGYSMIQIIDPATSVILNENVYTYYGVADGATEGEDDGWYTQYGDEFSNEVPLKAGSGFLSNFDLSYSTKIKFVSPIK